MTRLFGARRRPRLPLLGIGALLVACAGGQGSGSDAGATCPLGACPDATVARPDASIPDAGPAPDAGDGCEGAAACHELSVWVVGVGPVDPTPATHAAPVFIEHRSLEGELLETLELPTAQDGIHFPLTLKGTEGTEGAGVLEGALTRSPDGGRVALGGFAVAPGQLVVDTSAETVPRVVAVIDGAGAIDTSTRLGSAFSGGESGGIRAAVPSPTHDAVWVAGNGAGGTGGIHHALVGSSGASSQIVSDPNNVRWLQIAGGQLYGTAAGRIFAAGDGLPQTGPQGVVDLPDIEVSSPSGFALLDRRVAVPGPDTLYVAEVDGIRRFEIIGGAWTLTATFDGGEGIGARGLAAAELGADVVIFAVTSEAEPESSVQTPRVIAYIDDRSTQDPPLLEIAPHLPGTLYRGIALPPQ
jgi:hypothetical protein